MLPVINLPAMYQTLRQEITLYELQKKIKRLQKRLLNNKIKTSKINLVKWKSS
jgi:hypothetical protein